MFKKTLQVKLENTLQDTPLVLNPVSSVLNKEETPSVQNKVLACNTPEVDLLQQHTGDQNSRVSDNVYVLNIRREPLMQNCFSSEENEMFYRPSADSMSHSFFSTREGVS